MYRRIWVDKCIDGWMVRLINKYIAIEEAHYYYDDNDDADDSNDYNDDMMMMIRRIFRSHLRSY